MQAQNDGKKNLVLVQSSKIQQVNQGINAYFAAILPDSDNENIKLY